MAKSPEQLIAEANQRLSAGKIGVSIRQKSQRLYLRATLPPRPGSSKTEWHQQDMAIRIDGSPSVMANPAGIRHAEAEAKKVGGLIATRSFDWSPYLRQSSAVKSTAPLVKDRIKEFENHYFSRRKRTPKTLSTWDTYYKAILNKLPQDHPMDEDVLLCLFKAVIPGVTPTPTGSSTREKACGVMNAFGNFLGMDTSELKNYKGGYSSFRPLDIRTIPSDESIAEWRNLFVINGKRKSSIAYQYAYSVLATYGLRPFEFFHVDWETIKVAPGKIFVRDGKSGNAREVYPCFPQWWEEWKLYDPILPKPKASPSKRNCALGASVRASFAACKIPCHPYDLRHAWAIRTMKYGWPTSLSAKMMDHSEYIHGQIYLHWLRGSDYHETFEKLKSRDGQIEPPDSDLLR
jgi:integrase